jgi:8-oxo-dGTP pyrophosphatase MutT (NUDIX family)
MISPAIQPREDAAFAPLDDCSDAGDLIGVHVVLRDPAGRYLCQLRDEAPPGRAASWSHPGRWSLFGGALEAGESARACALRETAEEIGVSLDPAVLLPLCKVVLASTPDRPLLYIFSADRDLRPCDLTLREGAGFAFLSLRQARSFDMIPEHLAALERDALRR